MNAEHHGHTNRHALNKGILLLVWPGKFGLQCCNTHEQYKQHEHLYTYTVEENVTGDLQMEST